MLFFNDFLIYYSLLSIYLNFRLTTNEPMVKSSQNLLLFIWIYYGGLFILSIGLYGLILSNPNDKIFILDLKEILNYLIIVNIIEFLILFPRQIYLYVRYKYYIIDVDKDDEDENENNNNPNENNQDTYKCN